MISAPHLNCYIYRYSLWLFLHTLLDYWFDNFLSTHWYHWGHDPYTNLQNHTFFAVSHRYRRFAIPALFLAGGAARCTDVRVWVGDRTRRSDRDHRRRRD